MRSVRAWVVRLAGMFGKEHREQELAQEMHSHLEMHIDDNVRAGMSAQEARRQALLKLGGVEATKEMYRERRGLPWIENFWSDLRFAARMLRKNPGFTAVAVAIMALGIGANTAMFSVVNAVLLKPLAFHQPDRIVKVATLWKKSGHLGTASAPDYRDWRDQSSVFEHIAYYENYDSAVTALSSTEYVQIAMPSPDIFKVFGVQPIAGREFSAEESKAGSGGAAILSSDYAMNHFGSATTALGQSVRVLGKSLDVVGVMLPGFHFPDKTDVWFPANTIVSDTVSRSGHNYLVVARLRDGVTLEQAQAQMTAIGSRLEQKYPDSNTNKSVAVRRMRDAMVSNFSLTLWVMLAAVGVVLLIACANLANMLLAKSIARTREIAIRAALGAGRGRIVRQLITESLLLALVAGFIGVLLAYWGSRALVALAPGDVPRLSEARIDLPVLAFALGASVLASVLFGLAPALHTLRVDLNKSLKQGTTRTSGGSIPDRVRLALVVTEIALSMMLLTGAGLLLKSFVALQNVNLGIRPERVLVMETSVPASDLKSAKRAIRFYTELLPQIRTLPGVVSVGGAGAVPGHAESNGGYWIDFLPKELSVGAPQAVFSVVTPGEFATVGIPLLKGRDFNDSDVYDTSFTAIINEKLARDAFPGQDPLGRVVYCGLDSMNPMKIVGVVGNIRQFGPAQAPWSEIYMPYQQHPQPATDLNVLIRTATEPTALTRAVRSKVREISTDVPVKITTMEESLSENVATPRFRTLLLGIFAGLAVCLAMAGVYGVMSYAVGQRANEIGLRMTLGACPRDVLRLVLRQALLLAAAGIVVGLACAAAMTQLLTSMLFGVKATDPLTYAAVIVMLGSVAMLAGYVPARRAMRVDPIVTLRYE